MKSGAWLQFGDRSQKMALEHLKEGFGVGCILSQRDLNFKLSKDYAPKYSALGAEVLWDSQFYMPGVNTKNSKTFPTDICRTALTTLRESDAAYYDQLSLKLEETNKSLNCSAVLAPAVIYESVNSDIVGVNSNLYNAAKRVGDTLGLPTIATVVLGNSCFVSEESVRGVLNEVTSLQPDGWYIAFEFDECRIPNNKQQIQTCFESILTFAMTGKPVLHAYAGPLGLLSMGFGAKAVGIGHAQNTWRFTKSRFVPSENSGGNGKAPPRFFSEALWGTIVSPDEIELLPKDLQTKILVTNTFSNALSSSAQVSHAKWSRWDANKHFVAQIAKKVGEIAAEQTIENRLKLAMDVLKNAELMHNQIERNGILLKKESTNQYQTIWREVAAFVRTEQQEDFEWIDLTVDLS